MLMSQLRLAEKVRPTIFTFDRPLGNLIAVEEEGKVGQVVGVKVVAILVQLILPKECDVFLLGESDELGLGHVWLYVTSHTAAQPSMAARSRLRDAATEARSEGSAMVAHKVLSSAKTSRLFDTLSNKSSMKTRKRMGPRTLPWGTPALVGLKVEYEPFNGERLITRAC